MSNTVTTEDLRRLLHYDPATGHFTWKVSPGPHTPSGARASNRTRYYISIKIGHRRYLAHRLAWLYVHGRWPVKYLDHIDGNGRNNRLSNLRECSHKENHQNVKTHKDNKSGLLGVTWDKQTGRWRSRIMVDGVQVNLGRFDDPKEAHQAYLNAKRELHTFQPTPRATRKTT